jgi:hypothetical protein
LNPPPDIRSQVSALDPGARVQFPHVGAVTMIDVDVAEFLRAYPYGWSSLDRFDPEALAAASGGRIAPQTAVQIKQLLAAAVVREFFAPSQGRTVPPEKLPGRIFDDAQTMVSTAADTRDLDDLARMLAEFFDEPLDRTRRVVDGFLQRDER